MPEDQIEQLSSINEQTELNETFVNEKISIENSAFGKKDFSELRNFNKESKEPLYKNIESSYIENQKFNKETSNTNFLNGRDNFNIDSPRLFSGIEEVDEFLKKARGGDLNITVTPNTLVDPLLEKFRLASSGQEREEIATIIDETAGYFTQGRALQDALVLENNDTKRKFDPQDASIQIVNDKYELSTVKIPGLTKSNKVDLETRLNEIRNLIENPSSNEVFQALLNTYGDQFTRRVRDYERTLSKELRDSTYARELIQQILQEEDKTEKLSNEVDKPRQSVQEATRLVEDAKLSFKDGREILTVPLRAQIIEKIENTKDDVEKAELQEILGQAVELSNKYIAKSRYEDLEQSYLVDELNILLLDSEGVQTTIRVDLNGYASTPEQLLSKIRAYRDTDGYKEISDRRGPQVQRQFVVFEQELADRIFDRNDDTLNEVRNDIPSSLFSTSDFLLETALVRIKELESIQQISDYPRQAEVREELELLQGKKLELEKRVIRSQLGSIDFQLNEYKDAAIDIPYIRNDRVSTKRFPGDYVRNIAEVIASVDGFIQTDVYEELVNEIGEDAAKRTVELYGQELAREVADDALEIRNELREVSRNNRTNGAFDAGVANKALRQIAAIEALENAENITVDQELSTESLKVRLRNGINSVLRSCINNRAVADYNLLKEGNDILPQIPVILDNQVQYVSIGDVYNTPRELIVDVYKQLKDGYSEINNLDQKVEAYLEIFSSKAISEEENPDERQRLTTLLREYDLNVSRDEYKEVEAAYERGKQMRESVPIQVMLEIIRRDPNIYSEIFPVLQRRKEFMERSARPGERHRDLTALFAGIELSKRAESMLNIALDRTFELQSEWYRAQIRQLKERNGSVSVPEIVLGAGLHSVIYNSERMSMERGLPAFTIEQNDWVGGQFATAEDEVHLLNSRTRAEDYDYPNLPGTRGSINTLGKGVLQQADIETQIYGSQEKLASAVRVNHLLASRIMQNTEMVAVRPGKDLGLTFDFIDKTTGERFEISTDRMVVTAGLGKEDLGLDLEDKETAQILAEEQEKLQKGEKAFVYTFLGFSQLMGDNSNPFPLEGWKNVILQGAGDSGRVAAGKMLGYETENNKSVKQLDNVETLTWMGQKAMSREQFEASERTRYKMLGLEFPRESAEDYYKRVTPIRGRGKRLERKFETIEEIVKNPDGTERTVSKNVQTGIVLVYEDADGNEEGVEGDHLVLASGFQDNTTDIFRSFGNTEVSSPSEIESKVTNFLFSISEGVTINYRNGRNKSIEIIDFIDGFNFRDGNPVIRYRTTTRNGATVEQELRLTDKNREDFRNAFLNPENIASWKNPAQDVELEYVYDNDDPETPIARKLKGYSVYFTGPIANLPLTDKEREKSPALRLIPENTASIFRYKEYVQKLAHQLGTNVGSNDIQFNVPQMAETKLPEIDSEPQTLLPISFSVDRVTGGASLAYDANWQDTVRMSAGMQLSHFKFPDSMNGQKYTVTFERTVPQAGIKDEGGYQFTVSSNLPGSLAYSEVITSLVTDPLIQPLMVKLTDTKTTRREQAQIVLPIRKGKVDISAVNYEVVR